MTAGLHALGQSGAAIAFAAAKLRAKPRHIKYPAVLYWRGGVLFLSHWERET